MRAIAASAAASSRTASGAGNGCTEAMRLEEWLNPLEAPFQRTHHAVFIARGQPGFPVVHPARVFFLEHVVSSSLPAPALLPLDRFEDEPYEAHQHDQRDVGEGDDAVEAPDAENVSLDVGQVEGEAQSRDRGKRKHRALARKPEP